MDALLQGIWLPTILRTIQVVNWHNFDVSATFRLASGMARYCIPTNCSGVMISITSKRIRFTFSVIINVLKDRFYFILRLFVCRCNVCSKKRSVIIVCVKRLYWVFNRSGSVLKAKLQKLSRDRDKICYRVVNIILLRQQGIAAKAFRAFSWTTARYIRCVCGVLR